MFVTWGVRPPSLATDRPKRCEAVAQLQGPTGVISRNGRNRALRTIKDVRTNHVNTANIPANALSS